MAPHRFFACFLLLAACADKSDAPPAESDVTTEVLASTTAENDPPAVVCEAGETRECKIFYTSNDEPGVQHCIVGTQVCRPDGLAWKPCGVQ